MIVLSSIVTALALAGGFYFGFKVGRNNELPNFRRERKVRQQEEEKEEKMSKFEQGLANLDRYDGTDRGQEDIV